MTSDKIWEKSDIYEGTIDSSDSPHKSDKNSIAQ